MSDRQDYPPDHGVTVKNIHPQSQILGINAGEQGKVVNNDLSVWGEYFEIVSIDTTEPTDPTDPIEPKKATRKAKPKVSAE